MIDVHRIRPDEGSVLKQVRLRALSEDPAAFSQRLPEVTMRDDTYWEDFTALMATAPERATFLAEFEGRPVGIVGAALIGDDAVEMRSMWTEPLVRRRGAGRRLVEAVIEWARLCGRDAVELWVARGNDGAERLYASCGFAIVDGATRAWAGDPCAEEVRMRLEL